MTLFIKNRQGLPDATLTLAVYAGFAAIARFLCDGVSIPLGDHTLVFAKVDPMTYTAFLAPILAAHGYVHVNSKGSNCPPQGDTQ